MSITEFIENEEWPILNGVAFSDGKIILLKQEFENNSKTIRPICESNLMSFLEFNSDFITSTSLLNSFEDKNEDYKIFCGEGGMGSDGFIYLYNKGQFVWYLFFDNSNPFISVDKKFNTIIANNNLNERWIIEIERPWKIIIEK